MRILNARVRLNAPKFAGGWALLRSCLEVEPMLTNIPLKTAASNANILIEIKFCNTV